MFTWASATNGIHVVGLNPRSFWSLIFEERYICFCLRWMECFSCEWRLSELRIYGNNVGWVWRGWGSQKNNESEIEINISWISVYIFGHISWITYYFVLQKYICLSILANICDKGKMETSNAEKWKYFFFSKCVRPNYK